LAKRAASKVALREGEDGALETTSSDNWDVLLATPARKKGQTIPSWKKHQDKKKIRQASKKHSTAKLDIDLD
jgi:hypothetical protein